MESEKPRGVSILAARGVAVAVPVPAAAKAFLLTRNLSGSFSSGSFPIRAPLTIDDDDDSGSGTEEHMLGSSDASSYSKGLDSGTDNGFESVSGDAEVETALEDVIMGGVSVLGEELGGEIGDGSGFSGGSVIYRPFAGDYDEETSVNYSSLEEESEKSDYVSESEVSEADRVSMKAKVVIPRAILSLDDDEFDEVLGSDDEEAALLGVMKSPVEYTEFGDMGMVEEPESSDSVIGEFVSTEEEAVRMNYSDKLDNEELSLGVPPGGSNDIVVENEGNSIEASKFKQLIEKSIIKEDGDCSIRAVDTLMKPCDVEGVEDSAVELGEIEMTDKPEYSGYVTDELVSTEEDMQVKDGLVSFETIEGNSVGVPLGDCNEFLVESEGNAIDVNRRLEETFGHLIKQEVGQGSISNDNENRIDYSSSCDADESMIPGEGSIGVGSRESGDEDTGNMIGEAQERCVNGCGAVSELEEPECEGEPEIGLSSESFQSTPTLNSVMMRNLEVCGGIDVVVSGCGSSDQKGEQEAESEGKQESEDIDRKLSLPGEGSSSCLRSFETANETVGNGEQISEQINEQVNFQSDSEPNQISVGIEDTSLLSVNDVERPMPEKSSVIAYDVMKNETQMAQLIHNHTFMELDEYQGTGDTREKLSESTFQNYFEELSSDHSVQLISEKVKERVEKTQLLKPKLQRIIRGTDLCSENSAVTEAVSKLSQAGGEHQTSIELDYVCDGAKIMLPEQEFSDGLDFSINVLVIGKTGVGKSATVNSIFGETKSSVGAFGVTTKSANYVDGNVGGILVRLLDTPGLRSSASEERFNQEVLMSMKKSMRTFPVDVILYVDRLDENPDIHVLRTITSSLGSSIWRKAIVVLTHAASNVPDSSSYKDFIAQRSSLMHQSIRQTVPELSCVDRSKMPEIVLAENNMSSFCGNKISKSTCPDWRLNLLISCCSVKIRSKADTLQKHNTLVEKPDGFGSPLQSFTLFFSLWNVLLHGANPGHVSRLHNDLEEKKRHLLDSHSEILCGEQSQEQCLEKETLPVKNQKPEDEERRPEEGTVLGRVRTRRGRLGFQATKRFGIYLDTSDFHTGFSIGDYRKQEEEQEGKILVRMRGSMAVLGLVPMLMSVFTSVYGRKNI